METEEFKYPVAHFTEIAFSFTVKYLVYILGFRILRCFPLVHKDKDRLGVLHFANAKAGRFQEMSDNWEQLEFDRRPDLIN